MEKEKIDTSPQPEERAESALHEASFRDLLRAIRKKVAANLSSAPHEETPYGKGLRAIYDKFRKNFPNERDDSHGIIYFYGMACEVYHPFRKNYLAIACELRVNEKFIDKKIYRIPLKVFRRKNPILPSGKDYPPPVLVDELTRNLDKAGCIVFMYR